MLRLRIASAGSFRPSDEDHDVERRARCLERVEHRLIVILAELGALREHGDDHRPRRFPLLEALRGLNDRIEQGHARAGLREQPVDALVQQRLASVVSRGGASGDRRG